MAKKIRVVVELALNEEKLKEENVSAEEFSKEINLAEDDVIDGVIITRNFKLGDIASEFYIDGANSRIQSIRVIDQEYDKIGWLKEAMDRLNKFQYEEGHSAQEELKFLEDVKVIIEKHN